LGERPGRRVHVAVDLLRGIKRPEAEAVMLRLLKDARSAGTRIEIGVRLCEMGTSSSAALAAMEKIVVVHKDVQEVLELIEDLSALKTMLGLASPDTEAPLKVFLDDERPAPEGWTLARWPDEVIMLL